MKQTSGVWTIRGALCAMAIGVAACTGAPVASVSANANRGDAPRHEHGAAGQGTDVDGDADGDADGDVVPEERPRPDAASVQRLGPRPGPPPKVIEPSVRASMIDWKLGLTNAAVRDRALEGVVRDYLTIARDVFMHFRAAKAGPGQEGAYDPMPAWRFQARSAPRLLAISIRAALLREYLVEFAATHDVVLQGMDPGAPPVRPDRHAPGDPGTATTFADRLSVFSQLCGCIYEDAWRRQMHGAALIRLADKAADSLTSNERDELMHREVAMLRTTMRCTALTGRLRPQRRD
jgi:hypothetical protein